MSKPKKCAICDESFNQYKSLQIVCSPTCAIAYAKKKQQQREYMESIKTPRISKEQTLEHAHELTQEVFNRWVRIVKEKDADCCISCRQPRGTFKENAGHFKSVGHAAILRYEPDNVHLQCYQCNGPKSGNIGEYRRHLIAKIGLERVEWLDTEAHKVKDDYTVAGLKRLRAKLSKEIREVESCPT